MYPANQQTIEMSTFGINGHVIDHSWYKIIKKPTAKDPTGKPYLTAIILLSDIVYWHKPAHRYDELKGIHTYGKKFKKDLLQKSYIQIEEQLGFTKDQARDAIEFLESLGLVQRVFRDEIIKGIKVQNIMYIKFFNKKLVELMNAYYESKKEIDISEVSDMPNGTFPHGGSKKPTYTKTTTETTPETSIIDNVAKQDNAVDSVFFDEKIKDIDKSKFPLKKDQIPIFDEMKALDLGCDDETLKIVIREQIKLNKLDFLKQCLHHLRLKIDQGFKFRKEKIAFLRNCLSGKQSIVTENCIENKKLAEQFCKDLQWHGVKITDKFIEATNGNITKEIPTLISKSEFERMLIELYRFFNQPCEG